MTLAGEPPYPYQIPENLSMFPTIDVTDLAYSIVSDAQELNLRRQYDELVMHPALEAIAIQLEEADEIHAGLQERIVELGFDVETANNTIDFLQVRNKEQREIIAVLRGLILSAINN